MLHSPIFSILGQDTEDQAVSSGVQMYSYRDAYRIRLFEWAMLYKVHE